MESNTYILQRCQFEECEATIFIKGPYCTTHTNSADRLQPVGFTMSSSTPGQQQPNNHQHSPRAASQPKGYSIGTTIAVPTAPQIERRGDAITVKAPPPAASPTSEKKQLPAKLVARKTAGATSSNSKHEVVGSRKTEPKPPFYRSSTGDATSPSQRPLKRPRLSTDVDKSEREAHRHNASFLRSSSHPSPVVTSANTTSNGPVPVEPSDFALRPRNGVSSPLETTSRPTTQEGRPASKPLHQDRARKQQGSYDNLQSHKVPTHEIIDLTGDDKPDTRLSNNAVENSNANTPKHQNDHAEGSIKVQVSVNKDAQKPQRGVVPTRKEQSGVRKISSQSLHRPLYRKAHVHIAPRPEPTLLPPGSLLASPATKAKPTSDKPINYNPISEKPASEKSASDKPASEKSVNEKPTNGKPARSQDPNPPVERPTVASPQNDSQNHLDNEAPRPIQDAQSVANHASPKPPLVTSPAPTPGIISDATRINGVNRGHFPREQVAEYIRNVLENPTRISVPPPKSPQIGLGTPLPRLNSEEASNPRWRSPSREESDLSSTQTVGRSQVTEARPLAKQHQTASKTAQPTNGRNAAKRSANALLNESGLSSTVRNGDWKHLNPEQRRQVWISKHDPDKFDSYIYGKLNEPNRPGSALFGLPEYQQPPRPTRPAEHYGHIDPRVHWTRPRSEKWHREKQNEIARRGTRKSNFGQVVARTVKRRRDEGDERIDLPDRVKNNPAWLSAVDELDAMADQYYIQRRKGHQVHQKDTQQKEMEMGGKLMVADEDSDIEMDIDSGEAV
ncbi:hypothetical protein F4811DRAFT_499195 [Daldinia bambusicola]|nr:hypothetical protein F4811DRAFT_499195 [Daldinia bambusicola]